MEIRKKFIWGIVIVVLITAVFVVVLGGGKRKKVFDSKPAQIMDVEKTVIASGTVTSSIDLALAFKTSGIVQRVFAKVGQKVSEGSVVAQLDQKDLLAGVAQAKASLASAEANLQKVREGATSEEVAVAQVGLDNALKNLTDTRIQQEILVMNAKRTLLSSSISAEPLYTITGSLNVTGGYTSDLEGQYKVSVYSGTSGLNYMYSGLENGSGILKANLPNQLGTFGLYVTFPSNVAANDEWVINIPNKKSSVYVTNLNAYNAALETQRTAVANAENNIATAEANLNLKKSEARPSDLAVAEANVASARASMQSALAALENTIIRAPVGGTITRVDVKVGEQASALTPVVYIQDVGNLYVEANISEANIGNVKLGQKAVYSLDAVANKTYFGTITAIDPASTLVNGVVNYKVTASVELDEQSNGGEMLIRPGMTVNMKVFVAEKKGVVAIPDRALFEVDGRDYARVVTSKEKGEYREQELELGMTGDGGFVEIIFGIKNGDEVVTSFPDGE